MRPFGSETRDSFTVNKKLGRQRLRFFKTDIFGLKFFVVILLEIVDFVFWFQGSDYRPCPELLATCVVELKLGENWTPASHLCAVMCDAYVQELRAQI